MSATPLAEIYERLKELRRKRRPKEEPRRQGGLNSEIQSRIGHQLRAIYDEVVRSGVPDRFVEVSRRLHEPDLHEPEDTAGVSRQSDSLIRMLEIKTLADRVFGEEEKAEAWLHRPNVSLSGQRPVDLLKDELGTAIVREMLEQIDHGIFA
jgi:uncharacterized protein (DUF2384 family)